MQTSSPRPLALTDSELDAVFAAARPLAVEMRKPFLLAVAHALRGESVIGPGTVARICRQLQRQFFDPPTLTHGPQHFRIDKPAPVAREG